MMILRRYPEIHIRTHSRNPLTWVSAVRTALRQSRVDAAEIQRFTEEAFRDGEDGKIGAVISRWATVEVV
jgi:hypothetical protein